MFKRLKGLFCIILSFIICLTSNINVYAEDAPTKEPLYDGSIYLDCGEFYRLVKTEYEWEENMYPGDTGHWSGTETLEYPTDNRLSVQKGQKIATRVTWSSGGLTSFKVIVDGALETSYPDRVEEDVIDYGGGSFSSTKYSVPKNWTTRYTATESGDLECKTLIGPHMGSEGLYRYYSLVNIRTKSNNGYDLIYTDGSTDIDNDLNIIVDSNIGVNDKVKIKDTSIFKKLGYKNTSWEDIDTGSYYYSGEEVTGLGKEDTTVILRAVYSPYSVRYESNGGSGYIWNEIMDENTGEITLSDGNDYTAPSGMEFVGWKLDPLGSKEDYTSNQILTEKDFSKLSNDISTNFGTEMTLYAHWEKIVDRYTIKYDPNEGTGNYEEKSEIGIDVNLYDGSSFNREDYELIGWSTSKDGSTTIYKPGEKVSSLSNTKGDVVTLYAQWKKKSYNITYNNNIASNQLEDTVEAIYDKDYQLAHGNKFTNNGYTFKEWNTSSDGSGTSYLGGSKVTNLANIGDNINLYAIWVKDINNYTITYNVNDGSSSTFEQVSEVGQDVTINDGSTLHRDGYKFIGWNTKQDGTGTSYEPGKHTASLTQTKDDVVNLYAQWEKIIENYTIKYNSNDETNSYSIQVAVLGNDVILNNGSNLSREGYALKGWSKSKDGSTTIYDLGSTVKSLASNKDEVINLYAVWEKNKTVEDSNNGTSSGNGTNTTPPTTDKPTTGGSSSGGSSSGSSSEDSTTGDSKDESVENEKDHIIKEDVDFSGDDLVFKPDIDFSQDYEVKLEDELLEKDKDYKEDNNSIIINKDVIINKDTGDYKIEFIQNSSSIIHTIKVKVPSLKIRKLMGRNNKFNLKMLNTNNMKSITWTSKNPKVATVTKKGIIKTKSKIGIATIEADIITKDGYRFKYIIKVDVREKIKNTYNHSNYNIYDKVNPTVMLDKELHIGKPVKINFNNLYSKTKIKYYTSNKKVAKVNKNGYLVGKKKGKCNIKVVIKQNNYKYIYYINAIVTK